MDPRGQRVTRVNDGRSTPSTFNFFLLTREILYNKVCMCVSVTKLMMVMIM